MTIQDHHKLCRKGSTHVKRIHAPTDTIAAEAEEARNIVAKDHGHEVATAGGRAGSARVRGSRGFHESILDKACRLEDFLILAGTGRGVFRWWVRPGAALVQFEEHVSDVLSTSRERRY